MASLPTDEECARNILGVFAHLNRREGDAVRLNSIAQAFMHAPWRASDYDRGLDYALENDWLKEEGGSLKLTKAGFDEM